MKSFLFFIAILAMALPLMAQDESAATQPNEFETEEMAQIIEFINRPTNGYNFTWRAGAISRFLKEHSAHLQEILNRATPRNYAERNVLALALWLANTPEATAQLETMAEYNPLLGAEPPIGAGISMNAKRPDMTRLEQLYNGVEEANVLDMAWGVYDVTRDEEILASFIRCTARLSAPAEGAYEYWCIPAEGRRPFPSHAVGMDIVAMAAKWSILSRSAQDETFAGELERVLLLQAPDVQNRFREPLPDNEQNKRQYSAE